VAQDPHQVRVRVGHPGGETEAGCDEFGGVVGSSQSLVDGLAELFQGIRDRGVEQVRLRLEVVVEGAESHIRPVGDGLDADAGVTGLREDLPGRSDEGLRVAARRRSKRCRPSLMWTWGGV